MKRFIGSYQMDGTRWDFEIMAKSQDDAERRMAAIKAWGRIDGELMLEVPAAVGPWLPTIVTRILNLGRAS